MGCACIQGPYITVLETPVDRGLIAFFKYVVHYISSRAKVNVHRRRPRAPNIINLLKHDDMRVGEMGGSMQGITMAVKEIQHLFCMVRPQTTLKRSRLFPLVTSILLGSEHEQVTHTLRVAPLVVVP